MLYISNYLIFRRNSFTYVKDTKLGKLTAGIGFGT